jgi:hypothetical protein
MLYFVVVIIQLMVVCMDNSTQEHNCRIHQGAYFAIHYFLIRLKVFSLLCLVCSKKVRYRPNVVNSRSQRI